MKIFRQLIQFSLMAIAFAISSTLASCSSNVNPEDYDAVFKEVNRKPGFRESGKRDRDIALIISGLESVKSKKDYDLVKKYYTLYAHIEYDWERDAMAMNVIDYYLTESQFSYAKEISSMEENEAIRSEKIETIKNKIEKAEVKYLISLKSEEAANRVISILERPTKKPSIGEECHASEIRNKSLSWNDDLVASYHKTALNFNSRLDEYLSIALSQNNDVAAQKILTQYVEIAKFKTYTKKSKVEFMQIIDFSDQPRKDAIKRYKEAKELWQSLEN